MIRYCLKCYIIATKLVGLAINLTHSNKDLKPYWDRRLELTTEGQCLLWGTRVVIPNKLYPTVLNELHSGHPGIVRMQAIARSYVWWPGLDKAIEHQVKSCKPGCQKVKQSPPKAPLHPWVWPMNPWECIHVDCWAFPSQNVYDCHGCSLKVVRGH